MNIQIFKYDDVEIEFDLRQGQNMMVNATEMAKVFGKEVSGFLKTENTKNFVEAFCRAENIPSQSEFSPDGKVIKVISSGRNNGTWMNRITALKFAAWLNPDFEVWVYKTIDKLLYEFAQEMEESISESILLQRQQDDLKNKLAARDPEFMEYLAIEQKIINSKNRRRNATINRFREKTADLFSPKSKEE